MSEAVPERLIELMEAERKRLARDIHDGPAQGLTNATMRLEIVKKLLELQRIEDAQREIERLQQLIGQSVTDARRLMFDLDPTFLERGFLEAVRRYAERFEQWFEIPVTVEGDWPEVELSEAVTASLFRVYQEALRNVYRHAEATGVVVRLSSSRQEQTIAITDHGRGYNPAEATAGHGLRLMRAYAAVIGARLHIQSAAGQGTTVSCRVDKLPNTSG